MNDRIVANIQERYLSLSPQTTQRWLPQSYPFALIDRVKACYPEQGISLSVKHVTMTDPVLNGHFPGFPIYPGVLLIESMAQNAGVCIRLRDWCRKHGSLERVLELFNSAPGTFADERKQYVLAESRVKHVQPVFPGHGVDLDARLLMERDGISVFRVSAQVDGVDVAKGQLTMAALPPSLNLGAIDRIGNG